MKIMILFLVKIVSAFSEKVPSNCDYYNNLQQSFQESVLPDDFVKESQDPSSKIFRLTDRTRGLTFQILGRTFFESAFKLKYHDAAEVCYLRKMVLVALDTVEEMKHDFFRGNRSTKYLHADDSYFWTSGAPCSDSDQSNSSSCNSVTWCPTGNTSLVTTPITRLNKKTRKKYACLALERDTGIFMSMNCEHKFYFVCEHKCSRAVCPPVSLTNCAVDPSLFKTGDNFHFENIRDKDLLGDWYIKHSKEAHFFGTKQVSWHENWKMCCSLNMKPLSVDENLKYTMDKLEKKNAEAVNRVYWTGVTKSGCAGQYTDCFNEKGINENSSEILNNREGGACVATTKSTDGITAKAMPCDQKNFLGCRREPVGDEIEEEKMYSESTDNENLSLEAKLVQLSEQSVAVLYRELSSPSFQEYKEIIETEKHFLYWLIRMAQEHLYFNLLYGSNFVTLSNHWTKTQNENCKLPTCNDHDYKPLDISLFVYDKNRPSLFKPLFYGKWTTKCGVVFLHTNITANWHGATEFCSKLGMSSVTVQNEDKQSCLYDVLDLSRKWSVWTSAKESKCPGKFEWCSTKLHFSLREKLVWRRKKMKKWRGNKCVYIDFGSIEAKLGVAPCDQKKTIVCESRPRAQNPSREIAKECQVLSRVSSKQLTKFSGSLDQFSFSMKGMVQCIAENMGLITNENVVVPATVFSYFRNFFKNNLEQLEKQMEQNKNSSQSGEEGMMKMIAKLGGELQANKIGREIYEENLKETDSKNFDLLRTLMVRYTECKMKLNATLENFAFSFINCALEDTPMLDEIWTKFDDGTDLKDYVLPSMYSKSSCQAFNDGGHCADMKITKGKFIESSQSIGSYEIPLHLAFTLCAKYGGYLPIAKSIDDFNSLYDNWNGTEDTILWGEAEKIESELFWCEGNLTVKVPVAVKGPTDAPFFLISEAEDSPNLYAVPISELVFVTRVFCLHPPEIKKLCDDKNRTTAISAFENMLSRLKIK